MNRLIQDIIPYSKLTFWQTTEDIVMHGMALSIRIPKQIEVKDESNEETAISIKCN